MRKCAAIPSSASANLVELARDGGNWRRPVCGSSRAILIIGLKCCGQRCDLFVFVASVVANVCVNRDRNIVHLPVLLRFAMGGIAFHVAACDGSCLASGFGISARVTCATVCQDVIAQSSLCWQVLWSSGRSKFFISIITIPSPTRCIVAAFACHEAVVFTVEPHDVACCTHHVYEHCLGQQRWISPVLVLICAFGLVVADVCCGSQ